MEKVAVVTGATAGIGFRAAGMLAEMGVSVIGVGRSEDRCAAAAAAIGEACGRAPEYVVGDLSSVDGVREVASRIEAVLRRGGNRLDILMNVAGAVSSWHMSNAENYELQFSVNHLAPFLLTRELLPWLGAAEGARVLVVSSESHRHTRIKWDDLMLRRRYSLLQAYKQSKLCNVLFTTELARRLRGSAISTYAIDPVLAKTDIGLKGTFGLERFAWRLRQLSGTSPDVPARHMVRVATDPAVARSSGLYWREGRPMRPDRRALDPFAAKRLWTVSERLCGIEGEYFAEAPRLAAGPDAPAIAERA
jgi:NAD(P)-dependent dehydrogenase (short-subunit alcohol dehydrogenase family)